MLDKFFQRQIPWSVMTFGEGRRTESILQHIESEVQEVRQNPTDLTEWVDIIILALDGAWRAGFTPEQIAQAIIDKQTVNMGRQWQRTGEGEPSEHVREVQR